MKTIIVPTDFSAVADNATMFATDLARYIDASLMLVNIYQLPVTVTDGPLVMVQPEELQKDSEDKLEALKDKIIDRANNDDMRIYTVARMGDLVDELNELCNSIHPFAVVMATENETGFQRGIFGSNTLNAVKHLHCPVLIVPAGSSFKPIQKIGLACNFKNVVPSTPEKEIRDIISEFHAELHVLNVDHDGKNFSPEMPEQVSLLHNMIADLNPRYHFIDKENIEEGLNEFAEQNNLDFLIIIPKKHKALEGLFHKNHVKELALHSHVPVMSIHE